MIKITVPATSANLGIGYDTLGMAVSLYSHFTFERADKLTITAAPRNSKTRTTWSTLALSMHWPHGASRPSPSPSTFRLTFPSPAAWAPAPPVSSPALWPPPR